MSVRERVAVCILVLGTLVVLGWATPAALADPVPTWTYPCADDINPASCERLTYIAQQQGIAEGQLATLSANQAAQQADQTTGLTSQRLDLIWTGVWFVGGCSFGVWAFKRLGREATRWEGI